MVRFPQIDLPEEFPSDMELRLQSKPVFEQLHMQGEKLNYFYAIAHKAIVLAGEPSYDNPFLVRSLTVGIKTYEIVDALVDELAADNQLYTDEEAMMTVYSGSLFFTREIKRPDDFFSKADYALERMREDTPALTETVKEVAARYVNHDKVATEVALKGAAVIRAMHIHVDRRLAA